MKLPTVEEVVESTASYFGIPEEALLDKKMKAKDACLKRHVAMYLAAKLTYRSLRQVGDVFDMDGASVSFALKKVTDLIAKDKELAKDVAAIRRSFE